MCLSRIVLTSVLLAIFLPGAALFSQTFVTESSFLTWSRLPDLPALAGDGKHAGLGGPFVGVHDNALIIAGGANFPDAPLWEGGSKNWYADIFVLDKAGTETYRWFQGDGFRLPRPLAYGVGITLGEGVLCIGGMDEEGIYMDAFLLSWDPEIEKIRTAVWPTLPHPLAYMCGALVNDTIYLAGGLKSTANPVSSNAFLALDLNAKGTEHFAWQPLPPWPGPGRIVATAAAQSDGTEARFYLIGGRHVAPDQKVSSLTDTYAFSPSTHRWERCSDIIVDGYEKRSVIGAPGLASGATHILVFGGADGKITSKLNNLSAEIAEFRDLAVAEFNPRRRMRLQARSDSLEIVRRGIYVNYPGFSKDILAYDTITDTWAGIDTMPESSQITTTAVRLNDSMVIPSGEIKPGVRASKIWQATPLSPAVLGGLNYAVIGGYFLVLIGMGLYFSRRERTTDDYFKAGQRIPWWAAGLSIFGTSVSAITFMAVPAKSYTTDWSYFMNSVGQLLVVPIIIWLFLSLFRSNLTSAYEYLERRFDLRTRLMGSVAFIVFQIGRLAIVLLLPAIALSVVTGISVITCIVVVAVFSIVYTVLGGIEAVIWTDVLQVVVLVGGALLCLVIIAFNTDGGMTALFNLAVTEQKLNMFNFSATLQEATFWVVLSGGLASHFIAQSSDQTLVQRYLTTRDVTSARKSLWVHGLLGIPAGLLFFLLGTALYGFYKNQPEALNPTLSQVDAILPWFILSQLPNGISGIVIAGIFAASMSSLDSSMNSIATVITTDFYRRFRPDADDHRCLQLARGITALAGLLGMAFALMLANSGVKSLWDEFFKVIGLFAGGLAGLFLLGRISKRAHSRGVLVGFLASGLFQYGISHSQVVHLLLYSLTGVLSCVFFGYLFSVVIRPKNAGLPVNPGYS